MAFKRITDSLDAYFSFQNNSSWLLPTESSLDLKELKDIVDDCFLLEFQGKSLKTVFLGRRLTNAIYDFQNFFGTELNNIVSPENKNVFEKLSKVVKSRVPEYFEEEVQTSNNHLIKYRMKIYPLSDGIDKNAVKYLFGGMKWVAK